MKELKKCCKNCAKYPPVIAILHKKQPCELISRMLIRFEWVNPQITALEWLLAWTKENECGLFEGCDIEMLNSLDYPIHKKLSEINEETP
jgi:hypothetical protein